MPPASRAGMAGLLLLLACGGGGDAADARHGVEMHDGAAAIPEAAEEDSPPEGAVAGEVGPFSDSEAPAPDAVTEPGQPDRWDGASAETAPDGPMPDATEDEEDGTGDAEGNEGAASESLADAESETETELEFECVPMCLGRMCGGDGCGGTCGSGCGPGSACDEATGQCICIPYCAGRECGPDGCGGTCPPGCGQGEVCDEPTGQCTCVPACAGRECGPDGCGGTCKPGCGAGEACDEATGQCQTQGCAPACPAGFTCASDHACHATCTHTNGGVFAHGGCSNSYQCCDGSWKAKSGEDTCGPCVCTDLWGSNGCFPPDDPGPPQPGPLSFVVYGDTQFATSNCTSGVAERLSVPKAIAGLAPRLFLHVGDLMDHGYEDGAYDHFQECTAAAMTKVPFFPTSGNHDMGSGGILKYRSFLEGLLATGNAAVYGEGFGTDFDIWYGDDPATYSTSFDAPGDKSKVPSGVSFETFYAFRHENAYFISFEQGTRWWTNTPMAWVEKHLAAARADPKVDHVFVYMHHPFYSTVMADSADGECMEPVRKHYEALFRQYDVTMVFAGHAHLYEHFFVPDGGAETRADPHPATYLDDGTAIHYIVTGGGGGPLNSCPTAIKETSWKYFQGRACAYHVTEVKIDGKTVTVNVVKVSGSSSSYTTEVIDTFRLVPP